jgi:hypothetical protein
MGKSNGRNRRSAAWSPLLYFGFLEDDMFAGDRIKLLQFELGGLVPWVLLGDIVKAGIGAANELY